MNTHTCTWTRRGEARRSLYFLNKPSKKSRQVAHTHYEHIVRWFLKETEGFFHKVSARYFLMWIVKGIKGFACNLTNIYPLGSWWVLSKCTHLDGRRVPGWVLCKNTQHVPSGYLGGRIVGELQKWSKWTQWVNQDHPRRVLWWVLFENTQHVPGGYLTGWIGGELQKWSKWTRWVHAGYFVSEPTMYSPRTQWVNRGSPPVIYHSLNFFFFFLSWLTHRLRIFIIQWPKLEHCKYIVRKWTK